MATASSNHPLSGMYVPNGTNKLIYGTGCVSKHLLSLLPAKSSKAFIVTGASLANKTPLVKEVEKLLGAGGHHAGTFSDIKQHAPVADLDRATDIIAKDASIDTVVSIGGGSPIDAAKALSYRVNETKGKFLHHITIPTTLSAAECTPIAGFTKEDGVKTGIRDERCIPDSVLYDSEFAKYTPKKLWLGTGMRALDHSMELMYNSYATEIPCRMAAMYAAGELFRWLPVAAKSHPEDEVSTRLFLAAWASLAFMGNNVQGGIGLSHALGYALGSPYGIPHGETSCMTLGHVVKLKAQTDGDASEQIARMYPYVSGKPKDPSWDDKATAVEVGNLILKLVEDIGLKESLTDRGVGQDQLDIIVSRATGGQKDSPLAQEVRKLVQGLW